MTRYRRQDKKPKFERIIFRNINDKHTGRTFRIGIKERTSIEGRIIAGRRQGSAMSSVIASYIPRRKHKNIHIRQARTRCGKMDIEVNQLGEDTNNSNRRRTKKDKPIRRLRIAGILIEALAWGVTYHCRTVRSNLVPHSL